MDITSDPIALWVSRLGGWLLELALIFVLLFWMVGAYNRLTRMRAQLATAWLVLDEQLLRRAVALEALLAAAQQLLAAEAGSLNALRLAHEQQRQAALAVRAKPVAATLKQWVEAELGLTSPLARLNALVELQPELMGLEPVQSARKTLADVTQRLAYARQQFNDQADAYNAAVGEFPTRLLTRMFGFGRVIRL